MYLALARKYRPQKFSDLIGQPHITKTLQNAIKMKKLYPALIFSGMKGVGKTSASRILAKTLNCEEGTEIEPCNSCNTCVEITGDHSTDYIEIDGASNNGIEEIRSLKETVKYKPLKNKYRVVVIDEVHMLSTSAWNALLKTIEEPPEHTYFIMATTDFHKIPATIISRCQHFEFKRIPYETMEILLKEICDKEQIQISKYALHLISKSSEGSLRDAKKILDQAIAISNGDVQDEEVVDILGIIEENIFISLTQNILLKNRKGIIDLVNELSERGVNLRFFYGEYLKFFRELIIIKSVPDSTGLTNINPENISEIKELLKGISDIELLRYFNAARELEITMKHTESPKIILEYLLIKLSYFSALVPIEEVIKSVKGGKITLPAGSASSVPHTAPPPTKMRSDANTYPEMPETDTKLSAGLSEEVTAQKQTNSNIKMELLNAISEEYPRLASDIKNASIFIDKNDLVFEFNDDLALSLENVQLNRELLGQVSMDLNQGKLNIVARLNGRNGIVELKKKKEAIVQDSKINKLADKIKGKIVSVESID